MASDYNFVKSVVKYSAEYPYFGRWTVGDVYQIETRMFRDRGEIDSQNAQLEPFEIGLIDGDVICDALWREMSLNPKRFGKQSPFVFQGKNDIYEFCKIDSFGSTRTIKNKVFTELRDILRKFLRDNYRYHMCVVQVKECAPFDDYDVSVARIDAEKQWYDKIDVDSKGRVRLGFFFGKKRVNELLRVLRDSVKLIATQNDHDFGNVRKHGSNFDSIMHAVQCMQEKGVLQNAGQNEKVCKIKSLQQRQR